MKPKQEFLCHCGIYFNTSKELLKHITENNIFDIEIKKNTESILTKNNIYFTNNEVE